MVRLIDDGVLNWTNVGPLSAGASTSLVLDFIARTNTVGLPDPTNRVVATVTTPPDEPPLPPMTNDAPVIINPLGCIGDIVWLDEGALTGNGVQEADEGLAGDQRHRGELVPEWNHQSVGESGDHQ